MQATQGKLVRVLFPVWPRVFPFRRGVRIALRTAHIFNSGVVLGGYIFHEPGSVLEPWLWWSVITGLSLFAVDLFATLVILFELHAVTVLVKTILLAIVPVACDHRMPLLVIILVIGGISSHMPARFRHRLVFFRSRFADYRRWG